MSPALFIDTNVPIYAVGRSHPLKQPAARVISLVADYPDAFVTSVEVVQELLHRYLRMQLWASGRAVIQQFLVLMEGHVEDVTMADMRAALRLADHHEDVSARDLLHAGVMQRLGVTHVVSADHDFDRIAGVERLDPAAVESWQALLTA